MEYYVHKTVNVGSYTIAYNIPENLQISSKGQTMLFQPCQIYSFDKSIYSMEILKIQTLAAGKIFLNK
jgi:hypothetical protein